MHFTTLFILKNETLDTISTSEIEDMFSERFCYCCGEQRPMYRYWCDWFQIGGRWCDILKATRGITCSRGYPNKGEPIIKGQYSIVEIKDLTEPIDRDMIYSVATKSRIYLKSNDWQDGIVDPNKFAELLDKIDKKLIKGVIALIDCHD